MRQLYHSPLSPFCRKVRFVLAEKRLSFDLVQENVWQSRDSFLQLNPAGTVPVLVEIDKQADMESIIVHSGAIIEYLEETYEPPNLLPKDPRHRAEVRRLIFWFDERFDSDVTRNLLFEKLEKRYLTHGGPDMAKVRIGLNNIKDHLDYISSLLDERQWLGGDELSFADAAAAGHLSSIDYLGDVPWHEFQTAKEWYARIKSRPSFQPLLSDRVPGMPPPRHYSDLDF